MAAPLAPASVLREFCPLYYLRNAIPSKVPTFTCQMRCQCSHWLMRRCRLFDVCLERFKNLVSLRPVRHIFSPRPQPCIIALEQMLQMWGERWESLAKLVLFTLKSCCFLEKRDKLNTPVFPAFFGHCGHQAGTCCQLVFSFPTLLPLSLRVPVPLGFVSYRSSVDSDLSWCTLQLWTAAATSWQWAAV